MLFPTLEFAIFFFVVFTVAWAIRDRATLHKWLLLTASYVFYGAWDWRFCLLLFTSSAINYAAGRVIESSSAETTRKWTVAIAAAANLSILGFFKYYGFFIEQLADGLERIGLERDLPFLEIILPVGISFFTFQGISYIVDVYRKEIHASRSALDVFLYISFFPQLVAGPIVRAAHFMPQLDRQPQLTRNAFSFGILLVLLGLFKKMVIANYLATLLVDEVFFDPTAYGRIDLLFAVYGYAVQIYCDFSGYSDIAIGIAALLGYRFNANFNQPYRAASVQDFWRRWHISLSQWLRDYLYKPMGGSRGGTLRTYRNLLVTMLLGGLWHGAAWTFIVWGALHGVVLAIERALRNRPAVQEPASAGAAAVTSQVRPANAATRIFNVLLTFHIVCLGWIFFRSADIDSAFSYLSGLVFSTEETMLMTPFLATLIGLSLAAQFTPPDSIARAAGVLERRSMAFTGCILILGIVLIELVSPPGVAPFIYFQF